MSVIGLLWSICPTFTLTNAVGCDSVVTLALTINNSNTGVDVQVANDFYTWIDGVEYTKNNNTATYTLTNAVGADSLVTLDLTKASFTSETGTPLQIDLTGSFLIKEKIWLGAMWRSGDAYGFIAQFMFAEKLRVGYAIDFATTSLKNHNNGTHEIMVSYELKFKKEEVVSPRYF